MSRGFPRDSEALDVEGISQGLRGALDVVSGVHHRLRKVQSCNPPFRNWEK